VVNLGTRTTCTNPWSVSNSASTTKRRFLVWLTYLSSLDFLNIAIPVSIEEFWNSSPLGLGGCTSLPSYWTGIPMDIRLHGPGLQFLGARKEARFRMLDTGDVCSNNSLCSSSALRGFVVRDWNKDVGIWKDRGGLGELVWERCL
jgi:hypothetical protein